MNFSEEKREEMLGNPFLGEEPLEMPTEEMRIEDTEPSTPNFFKNLADDMDEDALNRLSSFLSEKIKEDLKVREGWIKQIDDAYTQLGIEPQDLSDVPFNEATHIYDGTLLNATIRMFVNVRSEFLPEDNPTRYKIIGGLNEQKEQIAEVKRDWFNYYLTTKDAPYYADTAKYFLHTIFEGTSIKKVYFDTALGYPISRLIAKEDFIIDADCSSILESSRITHVLHLSKRDIIINQQKGVYRKVDLPYLRDDTYSKDSDDILPNSPNDKGFDLEEYSGKSTYDIYETHEYLNLQDFIDPNGDRKDDDLPLPYIVRLDDTSKKILSINNNFKESDPLKKRIECFVECTPFPSFGRYGLGYAQLIGGRAKAITSILKQLIDAGTYKNYPAGFKANIDGLTQNPDYTPSPGEFVPVNTAGRPIQELFMPFPFNGADPVLREVMLGNIEQAREIGASTELGLLTSKENIPTGTMLAALEEYNKIPSALMKAIYFSFARELELLNNLFKDTLEKETFSFGSNTHTITGSDFADSIKIVPACDPSANSTIQKIMKAEAVFKMALETPTLHNMTEVLRLNYLAQGWLPEEIDKFVLPDPTQAEDVKPLDPATENFNIKLGKPAKAAPYQNHAAHNFVHGIEAQNPENSPEVQASLAAHIQEHSALEYLNKIQLMLGFELPPLDELENPEIQNEIALATAKALHENGADMEGHPENVPLEKALVMADIQQKAEQTAASERMAQASNELELLKIKENNKSAELIAQLRAEVDRKKMESNEYIAELKAKIELTNTELNQPLGDES